MIYLPNVINVVALTTLWTQYIYNPTYGLLHTFFKLIGLNALAKIQWTSLDMLFWSMLIAFVWGSVGWFMLIILAGAERIPSDYYEAARLDGANVVQVFFLITLPLLRDVLRVTLVMWSVVAINLFAFPRTFTPVVQQKGTLTPAIYLYQLAFGVENGTRGLDIGRAAAVGVVLLTLVIAAATIISRLFRQSEFQY
jgi:ABC-type sugar transport system permease subunit